MRVCEDDVLHVESPDYGNDVVQILDFIYRSTSWASAERWRVLGRDGDVIVVVDVSLLSSTFTMLSGTRLNLVGVIQHIREHGACDLISAALDLPRFRRKIETLAFARCGAQQPLPYPFTGTYFYHLVRRDYEK